ncbi:MAG: hypothetical protein EOO06_12530 [Chitinophagaceae bacterium]|nr:MAG: hypothetical protein EOO06_12530 [Chitinophagaceae bacterium]
MKIRESLFRLTHWETWHHHAKYIPIAPVWVWYIIRSGTPWFFTPSNPTLTFGGFEGEGKKEMYEQLPPGSYPNTIYIQPGIPFSEVENQVDAAGFQYPFIVKPNVGMMGFMFRKISNAAQLKHYHETLPIEYLVQDLVDYDLEVSAFYFRMPDQQKGIISGFLKKEPAFIVGNGNQTVGELMQIHEGIRFKMDEMQARHAANLKIVLAAGEKYYLSHASNRSQGGKLVGIDHEIDARLQELFDGFSHYNGKFYYGRYDIKCKSVEDLKAGKNFSILEFNGAGAGTQHVYANNYSLWKAMSIILTHWKMMFRISRQNYKNGVAYWNFTKGWKHLKAAKRNLMMLKKLDASFPSY